MLRVHYKELDSHPDDGDYCTLRGEPFTGVAYRERPNGRLVAEWTFRNGRKWGRQRQWRQDGGIGELHYMVAGLAHGVSRAWWPNGRKAAVEVHQYGVPVRIKEWDENGRVTRDYFVQSPPAAKGYLALIHKLKEEYGALVDAEPIPDEFLRLTDEDWR